MPPRPDSTGAGTNSLVVRPRHTPTDDLRASVRRMVALGLTDQQCSTVLDISLEEFFTFYKRDYETGKLNMVIDVGTQVAQAALDRKHPQFFQCASFILRAQGGWRDIRAVETTNKEMPEEQKQKLIDQLMTRLTEKQPA